MFEDSYLDSLYEDQYEYPYADEDFYDDDPSDFGFDPYAGDYIDDDPFDPFVSLFLIDEF